jgi:hypothetical protein
VRKFAWPVLFGLLAVFLAVSCKTTPEETGTESLVETGTVATAETPTPEPEPNLAGPADAASLQQYGAARDRAEAARIKAMNVNAWNYFPEDWDSAEAVYGDASDAAEPATLGEARERAQTWSGLEASYNDLYQRSLPQFAEERRQQLLAARKAAMDTGIQNVTDPADMQRRFNDVEALSQTAQSKYDAGDYEGAAAAAFEAYERYNILKSLGDAKKLQEEADRRDFYTYDPDNYEAAVEAGNKAVELFESGNLAVAQIAADESVAGFTSVIKNSWLDINDQKSTAARNLRQEALDAKANVAVKDQYNAAEKTYNSAFVALRGADYENSAKLFDQAASQYRSSRDAAIDKRIRAEEAIRAAEEKVADSKDKAEAAEETVGEGN